MKYIIVTGGVISGLGKGITISSIGRILKASGVRVSAIKIDPYLNVDAGTMSPFEHGETFVLEDGSETDLDLGNYERFMDITLTGRHNITSGKIFQELIKNERRGDFLGKTVQIVPHATDLVKSWIQQVAQLSVDGSGLPPDVCLIEVGGTVGDIESMVFLEALRQFRFALNNSMQADLTGTTSATCTATGGGAAGVGNRGKNVLLFHVSLVPTTGSAPGEQKSKPTQHSVKELLSLGLTPDVVVCRGAQPLNEGTRLKIAYACQLQPSHVISVHNVSNIYHVPAMLVAQHVHTVIKQGLMLSDAVMSAQPNLASWQVLADTVDGFQQSIPPLPCAVKEDNNNSDDDNDDVKRSSSAAAAAAATHKVRTNSSDSTFSNVSSSGSGLAASTPTKAHMPQARMRPVLLSSPTSAVVVASAVEQHETQQKKLDGENSKKHKLSIVGDELTAENGRLTKLINIVIVGKYIAHEDSYLSITKALTHSSILLRRGIDITWVDASHLEKPDETPPPAASGGAAAVAAGADDDHTNTIVNGKDNYSKAWAALKEADGVLVPGGFGSRGVEGMIRAAQFARESPNKVPYLGICLGMQVMVIEYTRHVLGRATANSTEFDEGTADPVVIFMPEMSRGMDMGGSMRLGARRSLVHSTYKQCTQHEGYALAAAAGAAASATTSTGPVSVPAASAASDHITMAARAYALVKEEEEEDELGAPRAKKQRAAPASAADDGSSSSSSSSSTEGQKQPQNVVTERHRHRYEVNPAYIQELQRAGLFFSGVDYETQCSRMEICEINGTSTASGGDGKGEGEHFYVGAQYHPEYSSRPDRPNPLIYAFVAAAAGATGTGTANGTGAASSSVLRRAGELHR